ncbi:twin-arginine translocation signal domain-containing protein, partial [Ferruginibacter sp.]
MTFKYNRRDFLKQTTAAGAGITLLQSPLKIF